MAVNLQGNFLAASASPTLGSGADAHAGQGQPGLAGFLDRILPP